MTVTSLLKSFNWTSFISTLAVITPIIIGLYQWLQEQKSKRRYDLYLKKEKLYLSIQENIWGFYKKSYNLDKQYRFIENVQTAWLYCPDSIIQICNEFIVSMKKNTLDNLESEEIIKRLMLEMRKDLLKNKYQKSTALTSSDYQNVNIYPN